MPRAVWNGAVLAESENTVVVEGNNYFPPDSINREYFQETPSTTFCPWKGTAGYFTLVVGDERNEDAAWVYADAKPEAKHIEGHIAFWRGVEIEA